MFRLLKQKFAKLTLKESVGAFFYSVTPNFPREASLKQLSGKGEHALSCPSHLHTLFKIIIILFISVANVTSNIKVRFEPN